MSQNLSVFNFHSHDVRAQEINGMAWFAANDVATALGYKNPRQAIKSHVHSEDVQKLDTPTSGNRQQLSFINESGIYALVFGSRKASAMEFKRWVTSEVLPSIRKTGGYSQTPVSPFNGSYFAHFRNGELLGMTEKREDEFIVSWEKLSARMRESFTLTNEQIIDISITCSTILAKRAKFYERRFIETQTKEVA